MLQMEEIKAEGNATSSKNKKYEILQTSLKQNRSPPDH